MFVPADLRDQKYIAHGKVDGCVELQWRLSRQHARGHVHRITYEPYKNNPNAQTSRRLRPKVQNVLREQREDEKKERKDAEKKAYKMLRSVQTHAKNVSNYAILRFRRRRVVIPNRASARGRHRLRFRAVYVM